MQKNGFHSNYLVDKKIILIFFFKKKYMFFNFFKKIKFYVNFDHGLNVMENMAILISVANQMHPWHDEAIYISVPPWFHSQRF